MKKILKNGLLEVNVTLTERLEQLKNARQILLNINDDDLVLKNEIEEIELDIKSLIISMNYLNKINSDNIISHSYDMDRLEIEYKTIIKFIKKYSPQDIEEICSKKEYSNAYMFIQYRIMFEALEFIPKGFSKEE